MSKRLKKILMRGVYIFLSILCIGAIYTLISLTSKKANDSIVRASQSTENYTNINPNFIVDFVDGKYVRFETVSSYINIEKEDKQSIWEKIRYLLGVKQDRKGIEISLIEASYDEEMLGLVETDLSIEGEIKRGFELTQMGREIGKDDKKVASKDTVIARDIYKGVDIEYQVIEGKGLKEEIVLNELMEYTSTCNDTQCALPVNRFVFEVKLDEGLNLNKSIDGGGKYPNGLTYLSDDKGDYFAHFLPEYAIDSLGVKTSNIVTNILETNSGKFIYEIILDPEWLLSSDRVFPIRIDPSIVHDSQILFDEGSYERVSTDQLQTIKLDKDSYSGTYTSSVIELEDNSILNSIGWQGYAQASPNIEEPFSRMNLVYEENFNTQVSEKRKFGEGSLYLDVGQNKKLVINTASKENITIEFWSNRRNISNAQEIFLSNLGSLKIVDNKYIFEDINGIQYITEIPVKYNRWQYISTVFSISTSSISIYIDQSEFKGDLGYNQESTLQYIDFKGSGYFDTLRIYERLLARNELLTNSSYGDINMQYRGSTDGLSWDKWINKSEYIPPFLTEEGYIHLQPSQENLSNYDLLSFEYLSDTDQEIILGSSKFENGDTDDSTILLDPLLSNLDAPVEVKYMDMMFTPKATESTCLLSSQGLEIHTLDSGKVEVMINGTSNVVEDIYLLNTPNFLSVSLKQNGVDIYVNGNRKSINITFALLMDTYGIGNGCSTMPDPFRGEIVNTRVSDIEKTEQEILRYHDLESRKYLLKQYFRANLQNNNQIPTLDTLSFSINQMPYGATNYIVNLNKGDMIVISQEEYQAQGRVKEINRDTGLVVLNSWEQDSTIPTGGFTSSAKVNKLESIYIFTKNFLNNIVSNDEIYLNTVGEAVIKNLKLFSGFKSDDTISYDSSSGSFIQYRLIFVSSQLDFSPIVSGVNIDYVTNGPTMEQVMRHGKWFNEQGKQPFWWSN